MANLKKAPEILECLVGRQPTFDPVTQIYRDGYMARLNEAYPISQVFSEKTLQLISSRSVPITSYFSTITGSLNEYGILSTILQLSASKKLWVPNVVDIERVEYDHEIKTPVQFQEAVNAEKLAYREGNMYDLLLATREALRNGFVKVSGLDTRVFLLPGQKFVEHCARLSGTIA